MAALRVARWTCADTLMVRIREAFALCLEASDNAAGAEFIGVQRIAV